MRKRVFFWAFCFSFLSLFFLPSLERFSFPWLGKEKIKGVRFSPLPQSLVGEESPPLLSARSWIVIDGGSGAVLAGKNYLASFPPASLTKIVSGIVALDHYSLDEVLTVDRAYPVGRNMGLLAGEKIKAVDLIAGLLIHSANDAAYVLAKNYPGGVAAFVERMNQYVGEQGLARSHFVNFSGEEDENHFSTARDLAQLARKLLENPLVKELVQTKGKEVADVSGSTIHQLETTNELLGAISEARGLKTGWTEQAGECFIGYFELPGDGQSHFLITVVLGSDDRFGETLKILSWVKRNVFWEDYSETHSIEIAGINPKKP